MAQTYEELKKKTVDELREIAKGIDNEMVKGYTQMNKEHLLPAICKALGIDTHIHHAHAGKPGVDKTGLKAKLRELKSARDKALEAHDHAQLKSVRRQMHSRMLGNGHCTRPVEMDCHFESICESCTFFVTTLEFRPTLQAQRDDAERKGRDACISGACIDRDVTEERYLGAGPPYDRV